MKFLLLSSLIMLTGCTMPQSVQFAPLIDVDDSTLTIPLLKGTNDVPVVKN
jgi:hypothetical protein